MHRITFRDYREEHYETTFGTCELCIHNNTATLPIFELTATDTETGAQTDFTIEAEYWCWGDQFTITLPDIISFAEWLDNANITVGHYSLIDYDTLEGWVRDWEQQYYGDIEEEDTTK